jgi:hypothetical protein
MFLLHFLLCRIPAWTAALFLYLAVAVAALPLKPSCCYSLLVGTTDASGIAFRHP